MDRELVVRAERDGTVVRPERNSVLVLKALPECGRVLEVFPAIEDLVIAEDPQPTSHPDDLPPSCEAVELLYDGR
jgi:hypothetical protein